jgi:hypothetical protein
MLGGGGAREEALAERCQLVALDGNIGGRLQALELPLPDLLRPGELSARRVRSQHRGSEVEAANLAASVALLKDRLGDQRGEWMGADKNSSPKRELGLYTKFTTKDTSLPRLRSHNGPTNPRNKPQTIPKRKHNSRSKGLSCPAKALANGLWGRGGRSARTGQTFRDPRADSPLNTTKPPLAHPEMRTVHTLHTYCSRATCAARTVRGLRADGPPNPSRPETAGQTDWKESVQELAKNTKNVWMNFTSWTVRQAREQQPEPETERAKLPTRPWISQTAEALEERFGEGVKCP